jgi:hypothetical protein
MRASLALWATAGLLCVAGLPAAGANAGVGFHPHGGMAPHFMPHPGFPPHPGFLPHPGFPPHPGFRDFARRNERNRFNQLGLLSLFGGEGSVVSQTPAESAPGGSVMVSVVNVQTPAASYAPPQIIEIDPHAKTAQHSHLPVVVYGDPWD